MSYTTPRTWADGNVVTASALNTDLRDNIIDLNARLAAIEFSGARWTRTTNQSVSDSTATTLTFPTAEPYDEGGWGSGGTAIVPAGAIPSGFASIVVLVTTYAEFANDADGRRIISLQQNGVEIAASQWNPDNNVSTSMSLATEVDAVEGDTFWVQVYHEAGAALNVNKGSFTISRRAPF